MSWLLIKAHLQVQWERQGWAARAGLSLLVLAAIGYFALVLPLRDDIERIRTANEEQTRRQALARTPGAQQVSALEFLATLPADDQVLAPVGTVVRLAQEAGVVLDKGEYRLLRDAGAASSSSTVGVERYQLSFPARTRYGMLRRWLSAALHDVPGLALSSLSLQRDTTQAELVEARVIFTLYLQGR